MQCRAPGRLEVQRGGLELGRNRRFRTGGLLGPRVHTTSVGERSFGILKGSVGPLAREDSYFRLDPPKIPGGNAGSVGTVIVSHPSYAKRPKGSVSGSHLEFHKAALEGLLYPEFLSALGL